MQNHYRIHVVIDAELEDLFPVSLQTRQQDIRTMRDAVACGDYEKIRLLGHSMKGSAGVYGFQRITGIGARIEHAAKEKKRRGDSGMAAGTVRISMSGLK